MTQRQVRQSGMFKYPEFLPFEQAPELVGRLCYIIKHFGSTGVNVAIARTKHAKDDDVDVNVRFANFDGSLINLDSPDHTAAFCRELVDNQLSKLVTLMKLIGLSQAQFFLVGPEAMVVDIMTDNRLVGPGMVRDIFGKTMRTQDVIKVEVVDDRLIGLIKDGFGSYAGDLIVKPTKSILVRRGSEDRQLYAEVRR